MNAARDGILTFMVGGNEERYAEAEGILKNMGKNVVYTGDVGTGEVGTEKWVQKKDFGLIIVAIKIVL